MIKAKEDSFKSPHALYRIPIDIFDTIMQANFKFGREEMETLKKKRFDGIQTKIFFTNM